MKGHSPFAPAMLVGAVIAGAACVDAASILARPFWPYVAWMLP